MPQTLEEAFSVLTKPTQDTRALLPLDAYIAQALGEPASAVYSIRVAAIGRLRKQVQQSDRGKSASVVAAVFRDLDLVEQAKRVAPKLLGLDGKDAVVAIYVPPDGEVPESWTVYERSTGTVAARLEATHASVTSVPTMPVELQSPGLTGLIAVTVPMTDQEFGLVVDARIRRMLRLAIASSKAVMLIGPPGTGKTTLVEEAIAEAQHNPSSYGLAAAPQRPLVVTPEESWTTRELLGGETVDDQGRLRFRPGYVLEAIERNRWLVLYEANRADMDRIFGGLLTFLSGKRVSLGRAAGRLDSAEIVLEWGSDPASTAVGVDRLAEAEGDEIAFRAGTDWRLLGTYNALDAHRVFRFGQALGRRFARVPVPAVDVDAFREALAPRLEALDGLLEDVDLKRLKLVAVGLYEAHLEIKPVVGPALFLAIPQYVASGLALVGESGEQAPGESQLGPEQGQDGLVVDQLVAESYLLGAGPLLAQLDDVAIADFHRRVVTDAEVLSEDQWSFVKSLLPALG